MPASDIVPVSIVSGEGIDSLRARLFAEAQAVESSAPKGRFRLAVDRSFSLTGVGTVVTGTVLSGMVAVGDHVKISPSGLSARVRSIHAQNRPTDRGQAGERCALNLAGDGIAKDAIHRGDVVLDPELHAPADRIDATLRVLAAEPKPITQWMPGAIAPCGGRSRRAASSCWATGRSRRENKRGCSSCLSARSPPRRAIASCCATRRRSARSAAVGFSTCALPRASVARRTVWRSSMPMRSRTPRRALAALFECAPGYVDLTSFARDRALGADEVEGLAEKLGLIRIPFQRTIVALSPGRWMQLERGILDRLKAFHADNADLPGIGLERLRLQLEPRLPALAFAAALQGLARARQVALDGAWVRLPGHEVRLTDAEEALWLRVKPLIADKERFRPPRVRDIGGMIGKAETDIRRLFKLLGRLGKVDEVAHDHFFLRGTVAEMVETAADLAAKAATGQFTAAEFRDRLDNGRKVAIQILEFFDRHGVTLRRGDLRRIKNTGSTCSAARRINSRYRRTVEGNRPRWGVRTSNPGGAASRSLVGSTPTLFRQRRGAANDGDVVSCRPSDRRARRGSGRGAFRREVAAKIAGLEQQRAFAFRRLNLIQAIAEAVGPAEDEETAVAYALAALRARLGWESDSEARAAVLARFAPVAQAVFASLMPDDGATAKRMSPRR